MISLLIRNIPLKKRIYSGYLVTGIVALIIALLSYGSLRSLASDFHSVLTFSRYAKEILIFSVHMSEMQRQALIYICSGHNAAADRVSEVYIDMMGGIERIRREEQPDAQHYLQVTKKNLQTYYVTFQEVRAQRETQQRLVRREFRKYATKAQLLIEDQIASLQKDNIVRTLQYYRMLKFLLQIEKNAYRYFDSLDGRFVQAATESIQETHEVIELLMKQPKADRERLEEIASVLVHYENSFLEAVQRTRGYLYLINVVMSAQAYETIYQVRQLSTIISDRSEYLQEQMIGNIASISSLLLFSAVSLLLFIGFFSFFISRSITVPLNRLTQTFRRLASGSSETEIPEYVLKDELGELTAAAGSFKQRNIALEESRKELRRSNEELEQFVYTVSHDLKSPIVTSMGFISIIRKLAGQGKYEQAIAKLDKVVSANERMSQLIRDLLELSRVGRMDKEKKLIDLNELLVGFVENQSMRLRNADFSFKVTSKLPVLYGNESRILQVFENILSNALKYTRNETGGRLEITATDDEEWWSIFCKDNGPGIPPEYHKKIFGLFYRLDVTAEGTGVGLAVVKKIMKFHGGDIQVEPQSGKEGEGAVFRLTFPKHLPEHMNNVVNGSGRSE
ncbi:MAG: HAMP domain-containing sensor histidine kinase [Candidatus Electrothrix sp. GW3-4]|uniref:sensor histidine kinase n=1 Tax=Candidatus Electrothrix sp. GW3-4 TaxID=3126740 RepID=UPI0030CF1AEA